MRTDAMIFNLSSSGNTDRSRMGRTNGLRTDLSKEFGIKESDRTSFQETYERVANTNRAANDTVDRTVERDRAKESAAERAEEYRESFVDRERPVTSQRTENKRPVKESDNDKQENTPVTEAKDSESQKSNTIEEPVENQEIDNEDNSIVNEVTVDSLTKQNAEQVIVNALKELSAGLNLKIGGNLQELSLDNVTTSMLDQFAEMVYALKNIAGLLDTSASQNQPLEMGNKVIDVDSMNKLQKLVSTSQFQIQMGLNMLGIADQVSEKVAALTQTPFTNGIATATNPLQLQMSAMQIQQVFGDVIKDPGKDMKALASKLMELVKENTVDKQATFTVVDESKQPVKKVNAELLPLDTPVMRGILKIDGKLAIANAEAAEQNGKLSFQGQVVAKTITVASFQQSDQMPIQDLTSKIQINTGVTAEVKTTAHLPRTIEESVLTQIADKMHTAVKSGATEVRIHLRPESLGEVHLKIRIEGDVVTARIQVESQQVKAIVENNLQNLKDSLSQQHLQAGAFDVNVGGGWNERGANQAFDQPTQTAFTSEETDQANDLNSATPVENSIVSEQDTGRRFGSNTVEYFA